MSAAQRLRLYHRLQLAAHRIQKAADRELMAAAGVTTAQAAELSVVAAAGGTTQREVARQLGLNESAVTAMTARLLRLGLLARARDPADPRAWRLDLSDEGRAAMVRISGPFGRINAQLEAAMSEAELTALADYLQRVRDAFET